MKKNIPDLKKIENETFSFERALFDTHNAHILNCKFSESDIAESPLKECSNLLIDSCYIDLRYPIWHNDNTLIKDSLLTENSRTSLWYCKNIEIVNCKIESVKAIRDCENVKISDCSINSPEFCWKSNNITIQNCTIVSEYIFLDTGNVKIDNINFKGKYSFQYMHNLVINNSVLDTKDAFWNSTDVTVYNSTLIGEYLGWFSNNLTLVNCKIKGTQPLCWCKNLKLINCTMEDCDLCFEHSEVDATIDGEITSVKNPKSGTIKATKINSLVEIDSNKVNIITK